MASDQLSKVRVVARTKPTAEFPSDIIEIDEDGRSFKISLHKNSDQLHGYINNQQNAWNFKMDKILHNASQDEVYHSCAVDLVSKVLEGYNATIMAFGQTGAGKTYTMTGSSTNYGQRGIIPRAISQLFREAEEKQDFSINIRVSYLEIYNDCIRDLLSTLPDVEAGFAPKPDKPSRSSLTISEDNTGQVSVKGLTVKVARSEEEALNMLFEGEMNRSIAEHALNQSSSRSHCIFTLYVESRSHTHSLASYTVSKLNLVDLAGSERIGKAKSIGNTEYEAKYINKSLSFLEQVTLALTDRGRDHIPYRQSKLTHILKDSIGGNCSTVMIANLWVEKEQVEETVSTIKFATRMMRVSNTAVKNVLKDPQLLLKEYEEEIKSLRLELAMHDTLVGKSSTTYEPLSDIDVQNIDHQIKLYVTGAIPDLEIRTVRQVRGTFARFKHLVCTTEIVSSSSTNIAVPSTEAIMHGKKSSVAAKSRKSQQHVKASLVPPSSGGGDSSEPESSLQETRVGENEGTGFSLGVVTPDVKGSPSPDVKPQHQQQQQQQQQQQRVPSPLLTAGPGAGSKKQSTQLTTAAATPASTTGKTTALSVKHKESSHKALAPKEELKVLVDMSEEGRSSSQSSLEEISQTPPPREDEFEKFKKGRGQKIHEAFLSNKEQYHKKKKECVDLADEINKLKKDIDSERVFLDKHRKGRQLENVIPLNSEAREVILDETEFTSLTHLKQLKSDYRKKYETLQIERAALKTLNKFVDKARAKLLAEFDEWYRVCYIGGEPIDGTLCEDMEEDIDNKKTRAESEYERYERLQNDLLKKDPSTAAFYHAQLRTEKRSYSRTKKQGRKAGELTATVRNKPPGVMAFT